MTLRAYLRVLQERWRLVAVFVLAGTAMAVLVTVTSPKVYQADVQIFVASNSASNSSTDFQQAAFTQTQVQTFAQIVGSQDVLDRVIQRLGLSSNRQALKSKISATAPTGQSIVDVHAQDSSPLLACQIANSTAETFVAVVENYYATQPTSITNPAAPPSCSSSSNPNPTQSLVNQSNLTLRLYITNRAVIPTSPVSPKPLLNVTLGLLLGLLVGAALAVVRDILDNRIKDPEALAKFAGKPVMGVIVEDPTAKRYPIAARAGNRNARAENFRQLRANLQFANVDKHPRVIAITSSIPGEGKTMVAMNLASAFAEAGFTVCLVDADLRRPTVAKALGLADPVGLTSVLIHQIGLSEALQSSGPNLYVLAAGPTPPNPSEVLASTYVRDVVRSLLDKVDYVVIDTAPLLPVSDGSEVAALADGTLLVGRHEVTTDSQVKRATGTLRGVDATLLGVVLNRVPNRRSGEYGYSYYQREASASTRRHRNAADRESAEQRANVEQREESGRPLPS